MSLNGIRRTSRVLSRQFVALLLVSSGSVMLAAQPAGAQQAGQFADAIAQLAGQLRAEILRLPATTTVEDYEASLLFLVDQSGQPVNVVCAAIGEVKLEAATPGNAKIAMTNVCRSISRRRGTGAVGNSGLDFQTPPFPAPVVRDPGGKSGY